jgi:hypothetical protein
MHDNRDRFLIYSAALCCARWGSDCSACCLGIILFHAGASSPQMPLEGRSPCPTLTRLYCFGAMAHEKVALDSRGLPLLISVLSQTMSGLKPELIARTNGGHS